MEPIKLMKPTCSYSCGQARVYMEVHEPSFRPFADISIVFVAMAKKVVCIRAKWPIMPALSHRFQKYEATRSISTPPVWNASRLQGYTQQ